MGRRAKHIGLRFPAPMVLADVLEARFGVLPARAKALALELLAPAVASGNQAEVARALERIDRELADVLHPRDVEATAEDVARRVDAAHSKAFYTALGAAVGATILAQGSGAPPIPPGLMPPGLLGEPSPQRKLVLVAKLSAEPRLIADQFAKKNAALIQSLRAEVVPALRDEVVRAVEFGITPEQMAERLADKWARKGVPVASGNAEPRLRLICRDQVAKLNADLTRARQTSSGVRSFLWISKRDDSVRPLHEDIDGEEYTWASGHPTEGFPGEPINCRCVPEAVVDRDQVLASPGFIHLAEAELELVA